MGIKLNEDGDLAPPDCKTRSSILPALHFEMVHPRCGGGYGVHPDLPFRTEGQILPAAGSGGRCWLTSPSLSGNHRDELSHPKLCPLPGSSLHPMTSQWYKVPVPSPQFRTTLEAHPKSRAHYGGG